LSNFVANVDTNGKWNNEFLVPIDAVFGKYTAEISDGREPKLVSWIVESSESIQISPTKIQFDPGAIMIFNGTAIPNQELEVILENPQGSEIFSNIISVGSDGVVEFEIPTTFDDVDGTYILYSFQGNNNAITLIGLGQPPQAQLIAKTGKLNYQVGDIVNFAIQGPPSSTVKLLIIDPSENTTSDSIELGADGKNSYELDIDGYSSGVYSVVFSGVGTKSEVVFSVGLQTATGTVKIGTTKSEYKPGDPILILGESDKEVLVTLTLLDPDGKISKTKLTITDADGKISESSIRIPADAKIGNWKIRASSGPNLDIIEFDVSPSLEEEGMVIIIGEFESFPGIGKVVNIKVLGAQQAVDITVTSPSGEIIGEKLHITGKGEINTKWPIPPEASPGTYTIFVKDAFNNATVNFVLE